MTHEIKIGGRAFVVDDPNGALTRVSERDIVVNHLEAEPIQVTLQAKLERQKELAPRTVDVVLIRANVKLIEALMSGRIGLVGITFAWFVIGVPSLLVAWGFWHLASPLLFSATASTEQKIFRAAMLLLAESFPGLGFGLLFKATFAMLRGSSSRS